MRLIKNIIKYGTVFLAGVYVGHGGCSREEAVKPIYEIKEEKVLEKIVKDEPETRLQI